ncbi:hypothetical protein F5B22DRAFT_622376 [Xylaria bambusicola]|uniref:uncharacterized protein n=1 Tax=Xylaria bambusicola TaxID=326684 RepID=UPI00200869F3|nr:uncharacterized protein F5B22DRAFT_622376 [Xylaria bambusicola]KAI0506873.1 hypothetical protein F5B22DRAFT_622376 [Xylaria bambusicola]
MEVPSAKSRVYRSPISRDYKIKSFTRSHKKLGRGHNEVTVYNWNCQSYGAYDPHPNYRVRNQEYTEWEQESNRYLVERSERPEEESSQLTAYLVDYQERNPLSNALNDLPIGPNADTQDIFNEVDAITQAESNNAEWRYITESVKNLEKFHDKPREYRDKARGSHPLVIQGEAAIDRTWQQDSPATSQTSSQSIDENSIFDNHNNNGTLSYGLGNISEFDQSESREFSEERTDEYGGHSNLLFPAPPKPSPRLLCEFIGYGKCKRTFAPVDFDAWVEHITNDHMQGQLPVVHLCWFCDDSVFRAENPRDEGSIKANYVESLSHIRDHLIEDGLQAENIRPDYALNEHLRASGLIPDLVYRRVLEFTELPNIVNGQRPPILASPAAQQHEGRSQSIFIDLAKEKRHLKQNKKSPLQALHGLDNQKDTQLRSTKRTSAWILIHGLRKLFWPRLKRNLIRVSWTCRCGKPLFIDVHPGQEQNALEFAQAAAGEIGQIQISHNNSDQSQQASISGSNIASGTIKDSLSTSHPSTPSPTFWRSTRMPQPPELPPGTKRFLLLCVNTGPYQIRLGHIDLTNVIWDVSLYCLIREMYQSMRGPLAKNMFIVPKSVEYVKFELINRSKTGECIGNYEIDSIPGTEEIARKEYTLSPYPPPIGRVPIQPHVFMHSFLNPGDHLGGLSVQQLPKKLGRKLKCTTQPRNPLDIPYGWGIYIVEGVNMVLVTLLLVGALALLTLVVLLWSTLRGDVQGGTGIGQYGLAVVTVATGALAWKPLRDMY